MSNKSVVSEIVNSQNGFFGGRAEGQITGVKVLTGADMEKMWVCSGTSADYSVYLPKPSECAGKMIGFRMDPGLTKLVTLDAGQTDNTKTGTVQVWTGTGVNALPFGGYLYVPGSDGTYTQWKFSQVGNYASTHVGDRFTITAPNRSTVAYFHAKTVVADVNQWSDTVASFYWYDIYNFDDACVVDRTGIIGTNTTFLTDLTVGGLMWVGGESRTVAVIIDDTHCAVTVPFSTTGSGLTYSAAGTPYTIDGSQKRVMWANEVAILYSNGYTWTKIAGKSIPMSAGIGMNANQTFANSTVTKILFDVSFSLNGPAAQQEISSNRLRILRSGIYSVHVQYQWYWASAPSTTTNIWAKKNGSTVVAQCGYSVSATNGAIPEVTNPSVELMAGDYLTGHASYSSGSLSPTIYGNSSIGPATYMSITEIPTW